MVEKLSQEAGHCNVGQAATSGVEGSGDIRSISVMVVFEDLI